MPLKLAKFRTVTLIARLKATSRREVERRAKEAAEQQPSASKPATPSRRIPGSGRTRG